jgi:tRNA(Ile)-lysidine synthetase-like protein
MLIELLPKWKMHSRLKVAVSGGVDSMSLLHFLTQVRERDVSVLHVNHHTERANDYMEFVRAYCKARDLHLDIYDMPEQLDASTSLEHWWSKHRREWFASFGVPVYLAHHLDDQVETWLMSCLQGRSALMPWSTPFNCYRPFILTRKHNLYEYAKQHNIPWLEDPTNRDPTSGYRNRVRNTLLPAVLETNRGIYTVVRGKILDDWNTSRKREVEV